MTALYIILALLALIAILMVLRVGIVLQYSEEGFLLEFIAGPRSIRLYPRSDKAKRPKKEKKPDRAPEKT